MLTGEDHNGSGLEAVRTAAQQTSASRPALPRRRLPAWLRVADSLHRSLRRPGPIAVEVLLIGLVAWVVAGPPGMALAAGAALPAGLLFGMWKHRSCVQAQGAAWYLLRLIPTAATVGFTVAVAGRGLRVGATVAAGATLALFVLKVAMWLLVAAARRRGLGLSRALVIGPEARVASAEYRIHLYPEAGLVCAHSHVTGRGGPGGPAASLALMDRLTQHHSIDHVVCTGDAADPSIRDVIRLVPADLDVTVLTSIPPAGSPLNRLGDQAVVCLARPSWGTDAFKRVFDVLCASLLLLVLGPLMIMLALVIRLGDPGPSVFRQLRTGRGNRLFTIFKFRSMIDEAETLKPALMDRNVTDGLLFKALDDPRVTAVGSVIRRFSIDELPQLVNVVIGNMSLVGPRPLPSTFAEDDLFGRRRHEVLPGITGLWQVKGANALSYDDMLTLDCTYVATRSLGLDLRILLQTVPAVLVSRSPY